MRLVFDARMAHWTGVGRYIRELLKAAAERKEPDLHFLVAVNPGDDAGWIPRTEAFTVRAFSRPLSPYTLAEQRHLASEIAALRPDLVHFPQFNVPLFRRLPYVVTIHDLIYHFFPGDCPSYLVHLAVKRVLRAAVRGARRVLAVSRSTRDDIVRTFGTPAERIEVTHLGAMRLHPDQLSPDRVEAARRFVGVQGPYLLYTGNHSPHKNLRTLFAALASLRRRGRPFRLVITGKEDRHTASARASMEAEGVAGATCWAGFVPDEHLFPLYRGAAALVFPSLYEGFGLPPLEAFACRTPVVASNVSSIPEVLGDAALLLDPDDAEGFARAVERIEDQPGLRQELVEKGARRLEGYAWENTARKTVQAYRAVLR